MDKFEIITNRHYGFSKGLGNKDVLALASKTIFEGLDESRPVIGVFLDFSKALNVVDHEIQFDKLFKIGIRGNALNLIKSFLSNREQSVK